jgi:TatD DNase family protein
VIGPCASHELEAFDAVHALAMQYDNFWATGGVTDNEGVTEPSAADLVERAVGPAWSSANGPDHYEMDERKGGRTVSTWSGSASDFAPTSAARQVSLPLVIHTRASSADTVGIRKEEGEDGSAGCAGGVFHCFTETAEVARAALDLGFFISFSGILTFKSAHELREVAAFVPLDRLLIETDSPYLAPVPYRGKTNNPSYVPYVARQLAELRKMPLEEVARVTSYNFAHLFRGVQQ